ncbi:YqaE/Pmp3 family membrane protein [Sphingomonas sp. ASY06-1R]|uniref:YqaE/Pmp3 family membrane protein n=1 Tax=Sphingomonas sp. ASY06-1R TaxID=3445771 RepID=UPI003FA1DC48
MLANASPAALIAAILLPPLGIYLARGIGPAFWIGTVLTVLFWVPGILFALAVILRPDLLARA